MSDRPKGRLPMRLAKDTWTGYKQLRAERYEDLYHKMHTSVNEFDKVVTKKNKTELLTATGKQYLY